MEQPKQNALNELFNLSVRTRRAVVVAGGSALLTAGMSSFLGVSAAQSQVLAGRGNQPDWRFCNRCFSMFYNRPSNGGRCPAGGNHNAQGYLFTLYYDSDRRQPVAGRDSQFDWRFCSKCSVMFWDAGNPSREPGRCAGGGGHHAYGFIFGLPHDNAANTGQTNWRFCGKCSGVFFDDPRNSFKGRCPAGGGHVTAGNSYNFQLPFQYEAAPPQASLGQKIVAYALSHLNNCVDSTGTIHNTQCASPQGECTHLVQSALAFVHARPPNFSVKPYVWGQRVDSRSLQIGDIMQSTNARLEGPNGTWETTTQHTAIIETVSRDNVVGVIEQNANNLRMVRQGQVNLGWRLVRGTIDFYRALPA